MTYKEIEYISKCELEEGENYECKARNFKIGTWRDGAFRYLRKKFGYEFMDREFHWDDGPPFGTVKPLRKLNNSYVEEDNE